DRFRSQKRRDSAENRWRKTRKEQGEGGQEEAEWNTAYRRRVLSFALARVQTQTNPKTWACFEQHVLRERTGPEVGAELGLSADAVRTNATRVLARVRAQCADYLEVLGDA